MRLTASGHEAGVQARKQYFASEGLYGAVHTTFKDQSTATNVAERLKDAASF